MKLLIALLRDSKGFSKPKELGLFTHTHTQGHANSVRTFLAEMPMNSSGAVPRLCESGAPKSPP